MSVFNKNVFDVLKGKYSAEIDSAKMNLSILHEKAVGIGEHSDIVAEADKWVGVIAEAEDKLTVLYKSMPLTEARHSEYEDIDENMR